jgi:hypothetical protein
MKLVAVTFGIERAFGVGSAWIGGLAVAVVLYPVCVRYLRFKQAHPNSLARFV